MAGWEYEASHNTSFELERYDTISSLSRELGEFIAAQAPGAALAMLAGMICLALSGSMRYFGLPDLAVLAASATLSGAAIAGLLLVLPDRVLGSAAAWAMARLKARLGSTVLRSALGQ